jgi:hypothetical protein
MICDGGGSLLSRKVTTLISQPVDHQHDAVVKGPCCADISWELAQVI